jgi:hypothetical protein
MLFFSDKTAIVDIVTRDVPPLPGDDDDDDGGASLVG